jgi:hypothetical protein
VLRPLKFSHVESPGLFCAEEPEARSKTNVAELLILLKVQIYLLPKSMNSRYAQIYTSAKTLYHITIHVLSEGWVVVEVDL